MGEVKQMTFERFVEMKMAEIGMSRKELGESIGVFPTNIPSKVFNNPKLSTINKVLTALGEDLILSGQFKINE